MSNNGRLKTSALFQTKYKVAGLCAPESHCQNVSGLIIRQASFSARLSLVLIYINAYLASLIIHLFLLHFSLLLSRGSLFSCSYTFRNKPELIFFFLVQY